MSRISEYKLYTNMIREYAGVWDMNWFRRNSCDRFVVAHIQFSKGEGAILGTKESQTRNDLEYHRKCM